MPIRLTALLLLSLSACGFQSEPAPDTEPLLSAVTQSLSCGYSKHICDPVDDQSNWECEQVCGGSGHCKEYSPAESAWCATHPDRFYDPDKLCSPSGDPTWQTWCVLEPVP